MHKSIALVTAFVFALAGCANVDPDDVLDLIRDSVDNQGLPSVAVAIIVEGEVVLHEVYGERRAGVPIEQGDRYHIGSNTKSMTALLVAMLVDDGALGWDSHLAELLPDLDLDHAFGDVTIWQLLNHTSGLPNKVDPDVWRMWFTDGADAATQRRSMAKTVVTRSPLHIPGTKYFYSNFGYVLVGLVIETTAGESYEDAFFRRLAIPLGLDSAGFGPPGAVESGGPWGHKPYPVDPAGIGADNPVGFNSAGRLHLSLDDMVRYCRFVLGRGVTLEGQRLVSEESFAKLMTGGPFEYGGGWLVFSRNERVIRLSHAGSNTQFYTYFALFPESVSAVIVNTNRGDRAGKRGIKLLLDRLVDAYIP